MDSVEEITKKQIVTSLSNHLAFTNILENYHCSIHSTSVKHPGTKNSLKNE